MKTLILLVSLLMAQGAFASNYSPAEEGLNLKCAPENDSEKPLNYLDFTLMYDEDSKEDLKLGYKVEIKQLPFLGAEIVLRPQVVQGCEFAELQVTESETFVELYFECDGDGDAGFGALTVDMVEGTVKGSMTFPEGKSDLAYPLLEDTEVKLVCSFDE